MTGCDEERERIRQEIAARVQRLTPELAGASLNLQEQYRERRRSYLAALYQQRPSRGDHRICAILYAKAEQRRGEYLTRLYGKHSNGETETAQGNAKADEEHLTHRPESNTLL